MRRNERGAILVESALVVGLVFLLLFGAVDIALIGYDQMTVDAASFTSARLGTLGVHDSAGADDATHQIYPHVAVGGITHAAPAPAPSTSVNVDYGYNGTIAEQAASNTNRHGGASMMQPSEFQSTVTTTSGSILGKPIVVAGSMLEPIWLENGIHFDLANEDYNSGANDPTFQGNTFTRGENTPPYYVGYNLIRYCSDAQPWPVYPYTDCSSAPAYLNFGVAEHLDYSNWGALTAGADGSPASTNSVPPQGTAGTTFAAASCHQKYFAVIAQYLQANPFLPTHGFYLTSPLSPGINNFNAWSSTGFPNDTVGANAAVRVVYNWDAVVQSIPPSNYTSINDPQFALQPGLGC